MQLIEVLFERERNELNIDNIHQYNDVCYYLSTKPQRRQYMANHKTLEHTAPLLKFSLEKEMRRVETEVLDRLLFAAFISGMDHLIIDMKKIIHIPSSANATPKGDEVLFCDTIKQQIPALATHWNGSMGLSFNLYKRDYPVCYLTTAAFPDDTGLKGVYSLHSVQDNKIVFKAYNKRVEMYDNLFDRNWIVTPGIPPVPLMSTKGDEITNAQVAIEACKGMTKDSPYRKTLIKKLSAFDRQYRWRGNDSFRNELKELIKK